MAFHPLSSDSWRYIPYETSIHGVSLYIIPVQNQSTAREIIQPTCLPACLLSDFSQKVLLPSASGTF